jgi:UDP-glucuronate decarboxylase
LRGKDITVYGDGKQTRSFCYVSDLIEGMAKMMEEKGFVGPVNLGNPRESTILEIAGQILSMTGTRSRLIFKPLPSDDPERRCPDISLAQKKLGWEPGISLEMGLEKTIDYFREKLKG